MTVVEACLALNINCDVELTEEVIKQAHKVAAFRCHPDAGGTDAAMAEANAARDLLLSEVGAPRREVPCVCRGFARNPLCQARHEDEVQKHEEQHETTAACVCRGLFRNPLCKAH